MTADRLRAIADQLQSPSGPVVVLADDLVAPAAAGDLDRQIAGGEPFHRRGHPPDRPRQRYAARKQPAPSSRMKIILFHSDKPGLF